MHCGTKHDYGRVCTESCQCPRCGAADHWAYHRETMRSKEMSSLKEQVRKQGREIQALKEERT